MTGEPKGVVEGAKDITNMKKTYIKPETTVVALKVRDNMLISASGGGDNLLGNGGSTESSSIVNADSREVIRSRDAWEEW